MAQVWLEPTRDERTATTSKRAGTWPILSGMRRWLDRHEQPPEPFDGGRAGRIALVCLALVALAYTVVMTRYLFALHNTFGTTAEDLGIMDQVLWNTSHGHFMAQTICNPITDTNCLGIASRFAIHFEPILIPLSLLYLVVPNVKALLLLQVAVTASGVFPVYLLATRRLRQPLWGVSFGLLFLLYPALQAAVIDAFHPETLAVPILFWAFYCVSVRRYRALFALCFVAVLCKETLALDVIGIGLFVALVQRRWRPGVGLCVLGAAALALALLLMHVTSPLGHSPVASRLSGLKHDPLQTLSLLATDPDRRAYVVKLLAPVGFLPLLSPWVAAIALPATLLNLVSSNPLMYSGGYQYNSEIVPVLIVAAIDAVAWLQPLCLRLGSWLGARLRLAGRELKVPMGAKAAFWGVVVAASVALPALGLNSQAYVAEAYSAVTHSTTWPAVTEHDRIGAELARQIPASASVSAQAALVPHVSERLHVYQFPVQMASADYIFLDVSAGNFYPYTSQLDYLSDIHRLLSSCQFDVSAARDGFLLLHRLPKADQGSGQGCATALPQSFYSFVYAAPPQDARVAPATFADTLELVGYERTPVSVSPDEPWMVVTTYWRVLQPVRHPLTVTTLVTLRVGVRLDVMESVTTDWLPATAWEPGKIVRVQTWPLYLGPLQRGTITVSAQVRKGPPETLPAEDAAFPAVPAATNTASGKAPRLVEGGRAVWLESIPVR